MDKLTEADRAWARSIAAAHPLDGRAAIARGNHRVAQNDEPEPGELTETDLLEADVQRSTDKARRFHVRNDRAALEQDIAALNRRGFL